MNTDINHANEWLKRINKVHIPVLKQTARNLAKLKLDEDNVSARDITLAVLSDPLMVFKILSYANNNPGKRQLQHIVEVEQAIIMMGTSTFFVIYRQIY